VRAGQGQTTSPLQQWLTSSGTVLAQVDPFGRFSGASFGAATSATRAAWQDSGNSTDPSGRQRRFVVQHQPERTQDRGSQPDPSTLSGALRQYGSEHQLNRADPTGELHPAGEFPCRGRSRRDPVRLFARGGRDRLLVPVELGSHRPGVAQFRIARDRGFGQSGRGRPLEWQQLSAQSWAPRSPCNRWPPPRRIADRPLTISLLGKMNATTSETVTLRNFTVIRYAAQQNP